MAKTTYKTGLAAEALCRFALRVKGYTIVTSRYKSRMGEIDIIAARGRTVALVEVKARGSKDEALESIHQRQRERLQRAANEFLARFPHFNNYNIRFDVMLVTPRRWPSHIPDAWRPDSG